MPRRPLKLPQLSPLAALLRDVPSGPWSLHRVERERGPCRHTLRSALRGAGMRADAVERLARLLGVPTAIAGAAVEATEKYVRAAKDGAP